MDFPGMAAEGDIYPCRIVKQGTAPNAVVQGTSNVAAWGISTDAQKAPATTSGGVAAASGDSLYVFGPGEICLVECAGNIAAGAEFIADNDGKAVTVGTTAATVYQVVGRMLEPGAAARLARCVVLLYTKTIPA